MDIPQWVKDIYIENSEEKHLEIYFPNLDYTVPYTDVYSESMRLSESIMEDENVSVVGCNASEFECTIRKFDDDITDQLVEAYIYTDSTDDYKIPLFHGKIDSVENIANLKCWKFIAYDVLYSIADTDVSQWFKDEVYPWIKLLGSVTMKAFRDALFTHLGITQVETTLPGDTVVLLKHHALEKAELNALDVIKAICEINGVFGIINRDNQFEYISLKSMEITPEDMPTHISFEWQAFMVYPFNKVIVRDSTDDEGGFYKNDLVPGDSTYIVDGNLFAQNRGVEALQTLAQEVMSGAGGIVYIPYRAECNALPWVECGKSVLTFHSYDFDNSDSQHDEYEDVTAVIFNREMNGIQAMTDTFTAEGEKKRRVFGSGENLNTKTTGSKNQLKERAITREGIIAATDWVGASAPYTYTFFARYKNRKVTIAFDADRGTNAQFTAFGKAKLSGGSNNDGIIYAFGTKPAVDIPIIYSVE